MASPTIYRRKSAPRAAILPGIGDNLPVGVTHIPKVFHAIWLGGSVIPDAHIAYLNSWREHNPDWDLRLWTEENLPPMVNTAIFEAAESHAQRADILRLELLYQFGGIYLDTDMECLRPIEPILRGVSAFLPMRDVHNVTNCILGSVAGHPFFYHLIKALPRSLEMHRGVWINEASGPQFITRELDTMEGLARDVTLFHSDVFLPYVINEAALPPDQYPHAYGIHHYASSWVPEKSRQYTQAQWTSRRYRLLIAADWSASEQLVAIVDAYARLIPESAQVDLVFVTASDPTEADVTALQSILERRSHGGLAGVRLEAVREAASVSHDTYFVPSRGDSSTGLADLIVRMAEIGSLTMDYPRPALANLAQFRVEKGKSHEFLAAIHNWATSPAGADRS